MWELLLYRVHNNPWLPSWSYLIFFLPSIFHNEAWMDPTHAKLEWISNIFLELKLFFFHLVKINYMDNKGAFMPMSRQWQVSTPKLLLLLLKFAFQNTPRGAIFCIHKTNVLIRWKLVLSNNEYSKLGYYNNIDAMLAKTGMCLISTMWL